MKDAGTFFVIDFTYLLADIDPCIDEHKHTRSVDNIGTLLVIFSWVFNITKKIGSLTTQLYYQLNKKKGVN